MGKTLKRDNIVNLLDTIGQTLEKLGFPLSKEVTYIGKKAIAARLGVSMSTLSRMLVSKRLLFYVVYAGTKPSIRTNETMLRMTYTAWYLGTLDFQAQNPRKPRAKATREATA